MRRTKEENAVTYPMRRYRSVKVRHWHQVELAIHDGHEGNNVKGVGGVIHYPRWEGKTLTFHVCLLVPNSKQKKQGIHAMCRQEVWLIAPQ